MGEKTDLPHEPTDAEIEAEYERMVADYEQETGRCYYCHRPVKQCVCDDGDWEEFGDFYGITEDDL